MSVQNADNQFDAENESYMESVASQGVTDVNTVKIVAHAILRGYVNDSPVQDTSKRETDFHGTRNSLDVLAKYEAHQPGAGVRQLALDAAQGQDSNGVAQRLDAIRARSVDLSDLNHLDGANDLRQVITGILKSR